jgi:hypothetical protein
MGKNDQPGRGEAWGRSRAGAGQRASASTAAGLGCVAGAVPKDGELLRDGRSESPWFAGDVRLGSSGADLARPHVVNVVRAGTGTTQPAGAA